MAVTVDVTQEIVHLPSEQFDVAIRSGREAWPKLSCDLLGRVAFVPVGAPDYIRDLSKDGNLDWSRATLIQIPPSAEATSADDWPTWCNQSSTDVSAARNIVVSSVQLALEAAADGLGIAIGRLPLIDDDIAAGRLAVAVDHVVPATSGDWLIMPPGGETRREIVAFRNWLLEETSQMKWNREATVALHAINQ
jgi:DNA-binding transcriptional LysR family regulator